MLPAKSSDQVVLERRLRPIYDAIDSCNNKKAIQEAEKVLKKHPATHCAKALKALALIRSDRLNDAWPLIEDVEADLEELDENTIQAICHCFKDAYTPERICSLYERICASQPKNEHNLTQLFMSYVRIRNYKLQQKTALSLYKEFPRNPYYFWSVMSVVMQALSDAKLAKTMFFPLAEKMVRKMFDSSSIQAEAECDLFALVLEHSQKYEESANFLENDPVYHRFTQQPKNLLLYRILYLHMMAGNYVLVFNKCLEAIDDMPDDWHIWETMLNATFQHVKEETCTREERDLLIGRVSEKVLAIINSDAIFDGKRRIRGPYIARLALIEKILENQVIPNADLSTHELGDPMKLLLEYVHMFYSLPCTFCDISIFVTLLKEEQIEAFLETVKQMIALARKKHASVENGNEGRIKKPEPVKWAEILYHRMRRAVGDVDKLPAASKRSYASELARLMDSCSDSPLAAAAYAQLTAYLFWDLYANHGDLSALYEMILFLESVQAVNTDYSCRLMLSRAYALIGAVGQVQRLLQSLDVKYVQRDTLGYFLFGLFEQYGRYNAAVIFYTELTLFFDQSEKEISESIVTAYKNGSFLQIPRLINFLNAINHSLIATGADIENRALSACFAVDKLQHVVETLFGDDEFIDFEVVQDNRDLFAIVSFEGGNIRKVIEEEKRRSYKERIDFMKLRHLLLKSIAAIGMPNVAAPKLLGLLTDFKNHCETCKSTYDRDSRPSTLMQSPPPVYLNDFLYGPDLELLTLLFSSALKLLEFTQDSNGRQVSSSGDSVPHSHLPQVDVLQDIVKRMIDCPENWRTALKMHAMIRHCSRVIQTLALASITLKLLEALVEKFCSDSLRPKKGSKKNAGLSCFEKLNECLRKAARAIDEVLAEGQTSLTHCEHVFPDVYSDYGKEMSKYLLKQRPVVEETIVDCYQSSISDLRRFVARILKSPYA